MRETVLEQTFSTQDFKSITQSSKYTECSFEDCSFIGSDLCEIDFVECTFKGCDFSNVVFAKTAFKEVEFTDCKMIGTNFTHINPFLLNFTCNDCNLEFADFYGLALKNVNFNNCKLIDVEFENADLSDIGFSDCDFNKSRFHNTNLQKCDFSSSTNISLDPRHNKVKGAIFSTSNALGLLSPMGIKFN